MGFQFPHSLLQTMGDESGHGTTLISRELGHLAGMRDSGRGLGVPNFGTLSDKDSIRIK